MWPNHLPILLYGSITSTHRIAMKSFGSLDASLVNRDMRLGRTKPHGDLRRYWLPVKKVCKAYLPIVALAVCLLCGTAFSATAAKPVASGATANSAIVIGFVGGFVHHND